jgi:hypothetical protein
MYAMITVTMEIPEITQDIKNLLTPEAVDKMLLEAALVQTSMMADRVHIQGKDSFNGAIGTYSEGYMNVRTGKVPAEDGRRYNRGSSTKVILSLSRQMENDLGAMPLPDGFGVGYNNPENYRKAKELQDIKYKKPIWLQTPQEEKAVKDRILKYIDNAIRG